MERNHKILILILKGYTFKQVGFVFGITGARVRQITSMTVRKIDNEIYKDTIRSKIYCDVKKLRKHKNKLIYKIKNTDEPIKPDADDVCRCVHEDNPDTTSARCSYCKKLRTT